MTVAARLRALIGGDAEQARDAGAVPRVSPPTVDGCAIVLAEASQRGWRVRLEGSGTYATHDAPADLVLSTEGLTAVRDVAPHDLVATVEGGVRWDALVTPLGAHGLWVPVDPPGTARSTGGVVATATGGALRAAFGGVRDHLLGMTLITGDGRVIRPGGRVAKNVAGYDLTRLATGSFGAFGLIAAVHLRLRVRPTADVTLTAAGSSDDMVRASGEVLRVAPSAAACELVSGPGASWTLGVRLLGTAASVDAGRRGLAGMAVSELGGPAATQFWRESADARAAVSIRVGALPGDVPSALDLVAEHVGAGRISASMAAGGIRWTGDAPADRLLHLRTACAGRDMPLTVERAPWDVLASVGHFGAYRDGVFPLVTGLRRTFDPAGILVAPLNA